jgi:hypothetical protein
MHIYIENNITSRVVEATTAAADARCGVHDVRLRLCSASIDSYVEMETTSGARKCIRYVNLRLVCVFVQRVLQPARDAFEKIECYK